MFRYSKNDVANIATELNFNRDTLEKVLRLIDILDYLNSNPLTKNIVALKGGTAINLTVFTMPRLSVDIDLDFHSNVSRDEMLSSRDSISNDIKKYMATQGYTLSDKSRFHHSLDSFVFTYTNHGGVKDNIKIEINYSLRVHIYPLEYRNIIALEFNKDMKILSLAKAELFGSKIVALLNRAAPRDLYDICNMITSSVFTENEYNDLRKVIIFYSAITSDIFGEFSLDKVTAIRLNKIKTDLLPVIKRGEYVPLENMKDIVNNFILSLMKLTKNEKKFIEYFNNKIYKPELLFDDEAKIERVKNHPMVIWKLQSY